MKIQHFIKTKYGMLLKQDVTNEIMLRKIQLNARSQEETIKAVCSHFHNVCLKFTFHWSFHVFSIFVI